MAAIDWMWDTIFRYRRRLHDGARHHYKNSGSVSAEPLKTFKLHACFPLRLWTRPRITCGTVWPRDGRRWGVEFEQRIPRRSHCRLKDACSVNGPLVLKRIMPARNDSRCRSVDCRNRNGFNCQPARFRQLTARNNELQPVQRLVDLNWLQ